MFETGDAVNYVPDRVHAFQHKEGVGFPWKFGWKMSGKTDVEPLTHDEVVKKLQHIRKQPAGRQASEKEKLILLEPNQTWSAIVRAVNGDRADLDISDPTTGATLHYNGVKIDPTGKTPNSCHAKS